MITTIITFNVIIISYKLTVKHVQKLTGNSQVKRNHEGMCSHQNRIELNQKCDLQDQTKSTHGYQICERYLESFNESQK